MKLTLCLLKTSMERWCLRKKQKDDEGKSKPTDFWDKCVPVKWRFAHLMRTAGQSQAGRRVEERPEGHGVMEDGAGRARCPSLCLQGRGAAAGAALCAGERRWEWTGRDVKGWPP